MDTAIDTWWFHNLYDKRVLGVSQDEFGQLVRDTRGREASDLKITVLLYASDAATLVFGKGVSHDLLFDYGEREEEPPGPKHSLPRRVDLVWSWPQGEEIPSLACVSEDQEAFMHAEGLVLRYLTAVAAG